MNKNKFTIILLITLLLALSGCQLAKPEESVKPSEDRLIGVFVTFEYLDLYDTEKFLNDNAQDIINGEDIVMTDEYQQRLYGTLNEDYVCEFGDIEGIGFIDNSYTDENGETYSAVGNNGYVSEVGISINDNGSSIEGTITVRDSGDIHMYANPVYITPDERIYLLSGSGISFEGMDGAKASQTLSETYTKTEGSITTEESFEVIINYKCETEADKYLIKEYNDQDEVIKVTEVTATTMPDTLIKTDNTAYVIIEKYNNNEVVKREIVNDNYFYLYFFDNGGVSKIYYVGVE